MKDIQGVQRGKCNKCECEEYMCPPPGHKSSGGGVRLRCEYCDHTPVEHVKIIPLGPCSKCGQDGCDKYESESPNSYSDCQYCGCAPQYHAGAEKLFKKPQVMDPGMQTPRIDQSGNPVQTAQFGTCTFPGCNYPRRVENGHVHEFCSRTCSQKYMHASASLPDVSVKVVSGPNPFPTAMFPTANTAIPVKKCALCQSRAANLGHEWCERCYGMAKSQREKPKP